MQRALSDGYKAESIMIRVKIYDNAITIDGHAKRDENGDAACCAAVSAAVQTAAAFLLRAVRVSKGEADFDWLTL